MAELKIQPPTSHLCQICAVDHPPEFAHNPQSFYYQWTFSLEHGRLVTWADAIAHCSEEMKTYWIEYLTRLGIDIESPNITGNLKTEKDLVDRTAQLVVDLKNRPKI
jgi:hypothetical protein